MTWFIFVGDMLVMLFMVVLVIWVFMVAPDNEIEQAARIPLSDEDMEDNGPPRNISGEEASIPHG